MSKRNRNIKYLHPVVREKVDVLIKRLKDEKNPLRLFEGFRTPQRQAYLYSKGRTIEGSIVTHANAWQSLHQYGLACDFVLFIDGKWSWSTSGKNKRYWQRYHELAREIGLQPLRWEKPHVQLAGATWKKLYAGNYPNAGGLDWAENIEKTIVEWGGYPSAPPLPNDIPTRPALALETVEEQSLLSNRYRVNARSGLRLRAGPGTEFDIIKDLIKS